MASSSVDHADHRTMVIELKYVSSNNTLIHTKNSKINLDLKCSPAELHTSITQNCGVQASAEQRGFSDFAVEFFMWISLKRATQRGRLLFC